MPISPIAIATHGLLNSPLSVAAVRGHLTIGVIDAITRGGGGPPLLLPHERLMRQARREDEEIMAIIIAFMETQE